MAFSFVGVVLSNQCSEITSYITLNASIMVTRPMTHLDLVRDFVNTFDLETVRRPDRDAGRARGWYSDNGLVDDLVEPTRQEHADALAVREAIRQLLLANNGCE